MTPTRIAWRLATVTDVRAETPHAKTLILDAPGWPGVLAPLPHVNAKAVPSKTGTGRRG